MENIAILGGDLRNFYLFELLKNRNVKCRLVGFNIVNKEYSVSENIIESAKVIVAPIPFTVNGNTIYMPHNNEQLSIDKFNRLLTDGVTVISNIGKEYQSLNDVKYINLMTKESFIQKTNIATVEGIIEILFKESVITLHKSHILILGMGRIGSRLSSILQQMGAVITIATNDDKEIGLAFVAGYKHVNVGLLTNIISGFDFIINTIPYPYVTQEVISNVSDKSIFIDVASFPGSIKDKDEKSICFKYLKAPGIPGKRAPMSMARYILEELEEIGIIK